MNARLPSSLKWLIDKRARLDAELKRTEESARRARSLLAELEELRATLKAVDETLKLHEIQVDLENIQPVRSHYRRLKLPRGTLTAAIMNALSATRGGTLTTTEIVFAVVKQCPALDNGVVSQRQVKESVRYRLKDLKERGVVVAHHSMSYASIGVWSLPH